MENNMNEIRNNLSFTAKLSTESLKNRSKKWDKVEKIFESKTSKINDYEMILFSNKNDVILSTYDGDRQRFNILSKKCFEKLENLTVNGMATKLAKFLRSVIESERKANAIVDNVAQIINKNKIEEPTVSILYDKAIDASNEKFNTCLDEILEKDNLFKNNVKIDVSSSFLD